MSPIVPCLWFDDQAEAAAKFYTQVLPDARITSTTRYPEDVDNPAGRPRGSVITAEFEAAGLRFVALNGGPMFKITPAISFFLLVDTPEEADRYYAALEPGGQAFMPLDAYPWSPRYAWVQDRFGVSWQIITGRRGEDGPVLVPALMYANDVAGRADEAMALYTRVFPGSKIESVERYEEGEGPVEYVKHARFVLSGQGMIASDSHMPHGFEFTEGLSFQVPCKDQAEIDRYWAELSDGGEPGRCGWLKDRFGVSWQVLPADIGRWLNHPDLAARSRAFEVMMGMNKLDVAALDAAITQAG